MIQAIDTPYNGYLFRSRLEARWAVYFDELNANWLYEHEGYELGDGERYLPDFYFPNWRLYAEIKPGKFTYKEHSKCKRLANLTQCKVVELVGYPSVNAMNVIVPQRHYVCSSCGFTEKYDFDGKRIYCGCKVKHNIVNTIREIDAILLLYSPKDSFKPLYYSSYMDDYTNDSVIQNAIIKAKEARFEFNNKK